MLRHGPVIGLVGLGLLAPAIAQTTFTPRDESPEDCSPGAPTDPDLRVSRIRLVRERFRCKTLRPDHRHPA